MSGITSSSDRRDRRALAGLNVSEASLAGATAATLYARRGAQPALFGRLSDMSAYKVLRTQYIQLSGYSTLAALGLVDRLEALGAHPLLADDGALGAARAKSRRH